MENKTAVQWLYDELMDTPKDKFDWYVLLEKALKMEQEQYDHAFKYGVEFGKSAENNEDNLRKYSGSADDLTLLWEKVILMHDANEMTTERKDEVLNVLDYLDRRGLITLKFGI